MTSPADPIPGNADVFQRVDPDLKQRKKMVVPIAGHWWNTFPIVQSFSGSEVFLVWINFCKEEEGMTTPSRKRLMRERLQQDPPAGISAAPQDNSTFKMTLRVDT
ncbi:Ubiquitin-conjugating enzyme E2 1 [Linum perenne]